MQTVVLAAGMGSRMRPLTETTPKPMLPVAGQPLVEHTLRAAVAAGTDEIVLVVGYEGDAVHEHFGDSYADVPIRYAVQSEQNGTASALRAASEYVDDRFAVVNGDIVYEPESLAELFRAGPSIGSTRVEEPSNYGILDVEDGTVTGIVEKPDDPPGTLANAGAYVFPRGALEYLDVPKSERGEYELTDVLSRVIREADVTPVELEGWLDVGRPWELLEANERRLRGLERSLSGEVSPDATLEGPVVVEEGATVRAGVVVEGPALIRSGATVGPNAYVRGATVVGKDASVGHAVEIKNSVLLPGARVNHLSYVGDSVLGRDVNLGAGTTVANLRHDGEPVRTTVKGERVSTGRRKFGVVLGDGVKTGINTSLNAGVTLSSGATTEPGAVVTRDR
ncbi:bifunctional sugar-1-phosphate nucleotidylyltransferase/acetyltransferase [Halopiger aswanensis]|uniref:Bifunctional protein GlmU n=1 Tax=Halopiger aswanensis TaxID=148449 RepID=A0A3R7GTM4_9EURY|nr:bifunctional sugar-1-phosphate nucleotidylyltransferase/acetyltransferase [Halopiger aswanensis]RKD89155.1 bifunctional UDP-N-acetylglucosamine pyrophosphorylase/glucosamine-1-phosphate N-acetyltransferase [Halopiger aswanensis]